MTQIRKDKNMTRVIASPKNLLSSETRTHFITKPLLSCLFFMLLSSALVCAPSVTGALPPPSGLIGWWPGDGTALDVSANAMHGAPANGATFVASEIGQAFSFDGVDDYVSIPDSPKLSPQSPRTSDRRSGSDSLIRLVARRRIVAT